MIEEDIRVLKQLVSQLLVGRKVRLDVNYDNEDVIVKDGSSYSGDVEVKFSNNTTKYIELHYIDEVYPL